MPMTPEQLAAQFAGAGIELNKTKQRLMSRIVITVEGNAKQARRDPSQNKHAGTLN